MVVGIACRTRLAGLESVICPARAWQQHIQVPIHAYWSEKCLRIAHADSILIKSSRKFLKQIRDVSKRELRPEPSMCVTGSHRIQP
jgi:hypothetical protein